MGLYSSKDIPLKIKITNKGKKLLAQATGQPEFALESVDEKTFKFDPAGVVVLFEKNIISNNYDFILKQGGGEFRFEKE
jgi:hypothetical protein